MVQAMDVYDALSEVGNLRLQLEEQCLRHFKRGESRLRNVLAIAIAGSMRAGPGSRISPQVGWSGVVLQSRDRVTASPE